MNTVAQPLALPKIPHDLPAESPAHSA